MPDAVNYTEARRSLAATMDRVCDTHDPVIITRRNSRPVVMMSLEDYNSLAETGYLLRSPANARRLAESLDQAENNELIRHDITETKEVETGSDSNDQL